MLTRNQCIIVWIFGVISGFTLMISSNTLNFWLTTEKIDIRTIGFFSFISLPYAINFIWSPIFDVKIVPKISKFFGKRISWIIVLQIFLAINVYLISLVTPTSNLLLFAILAFFISFFSSTKDIILGALRTEIIEESMYKYSTGWYIFGYKIGLVMSGAGAMYLSSYISWPVIYKFFGLIILLLLFILIVACCKLGIIQKIKDSGDVIQEIDHNKFALITKVKLILGDIVDSIGSKKLFSIILLLLILFRLPDHFIVMMINPFLIHLNYNALEIATSGKLVGTIGTIIGGLITSIVMKNWKLSNMLITCGIIHSISHMLFIELMPYAYDPRLLRLFIVAGIHSITSGMSMAAYITLITYLSKGNGNKFRGARYSFFSSMMGLSRSIFPSASGLIVEYVGWQNFYFVMSLMSLPFLFLLFYLRGYKPFCE